MRFKLPKIQGSLNSNKSLQDNDARKMIHVFEGHAIVSNDLIVIVNIRDYVKNELSIVDEDELKELTTIVNWMNGKSFNKEFWSELTKEVLVKDIDTKNDEIEIEYSGFNKKIQYLDNNSDNSNALKLLKHNLNRDEVDMGRFSIAGEYLNIISKTVGAELKSDKILFSLAGTGNGVKFSFSRRDYIFGIIPESFESSMDLVAFDNSRTLYDILTESNVEDIEEDFNPWASEEEESF